MILKDTTTIESCTSICNTCTEYGVLVRVPVLVFALQVLHVQVQVLSTSTYIPVLVRVLYVLYTVADLT